MLPSGKLTQGVSGGKRATKEFFSFTFSFEAKEVEDDVGESET